MKPSRSNVTRVRRPRTWKHVARALLFLAGLAGGVLLSYAISSGGDGFQIGASEVRGVLIGAVFGVMLMQLVQHEPRRPPGARLPEGFGSSLDQLRTSSGGVAERQQDDDADDNATAEHPAEPSSR